MDFSRIPQPKTSFLPFLVPPKDTAGTPCSPGNQADPRPAAWEQKETNTAAPESADGDDFVLLHRRRVYTGEHRAPLTMRQRLRRGLRTAATTALTRPAAAAAAAVTTSSTVALETGRGLHINHERTPSESSWSETSAPPGACDPVYDTQPQVVERVPLDEYDDFLARSTLYDLRLRVVALEERFADELDELDELDEFSAALEPGSEEFMVVRWTDELLQGVDDEDDLGDERKKMRM